MLKYSHTQVYTKEVPNELSLGIQVYGCPLHCPGCHSSFTWDINSEGKGTELTIERLQALISEQEWVSCILYFGGEWDIPSLVTLLKECKRLNYKTALYSGHELKWFKTNFSDYTQYLDYLKVGSYNTKYGSIDYPSTNQRMYDISTGKDITKLFWKTGIR